MDSKNEKGIKGTKAGSGKMPYQIGLVIALAVLGIERMTPFVKSLEYWNEQMWKVAESGVMGLCLIVAAFFFGMHFFKTVRDEKLQNLDLSKYKPNVSKFKSLKMPSIPKMPQLPTRVSAAASVENGKGDSVRVGLDIKKGEAGDSRNTGSSQSALSSSSKLGLSGGSTSSLGSGLSKKNSIDDDDDDYMSDSADRWKSSSNKYDDDDDDDKE